MSAIATIKAKLPPNRRAYAEIDTLLAELADAEADFQARGPAGPGVAGWRAAAATAPMVFGALQELPRNRPALVWVREAIRCCEAVEDQCRREGNDPDHWGLALCGQTAGELANLHACWTGRYPEAEASAVELAETLRRELASIRRDAYFDTREWRFEVLGHFDALADSLPAADGVHNADLWLSAVEDRLAQIVPIDADQARALTDLRFGVGLVRRRHSDPAPARAPYRRVRRAGPKSQSTPALTRSRMLIVLIAAVLVPFVCVGWLMDVPLEVSIMLLLLLMTPSAALLMFVLAWTWAMDSLAAKHPRLRAILGPMLMGSIVAMVAWGLAGLPWEFSLVCGVAGALWERFSLSESHDGFH